MPCRCCHSPRPRPHNLNGTFAPRSCRQGLTVDRGGLLRPCMHLSSVLPKWPISLHAPPSATMPTMTTRVVTVPCPPRWSERLPMNKPWCQGLRRHLRRPHPRLLLSVLLHHSLFRLACVIAPVAVAAT